MLFTIFSVFYVLIAAAMIVLILMQRGDGANAGASFGGGGSGTVFGARGSASFLTRTTAVLAGLFFVLSLGMGIYLSHHGVNPTPKQTLGVMAGVGGSAPATSAPASSAAPVASAPVSSAAPTSSASVPVQHSEVPAAPAVSGGAKSDLPTSPAKTSAPASAPASSSSPAPH